MPFLRCRLLSHVAPYPKWPEPRHADAEAAVEAYLRGDASREEMCARLPVPAIVTSHGPKGLPVYHVGVYLGENEVAEFGPRQGAVRIRLDTNFLERAKKDGCKCPNPTRRLVHVHVPSAAPGLRTRLAQAHVLFPRRRYHLLACNCEHYARFLLYGRTTSPQGAAAMRRIALAAMVPLAAAALVACARRA